MSPFISHRGEDGSIIRCRNFLLYHSNKSDLISVKPRQFHLTKHRMQGPLREHRMCKSVDATIVRTDCTHLMMWYGNDDAVNGVMIDRSPSMNEQIASAQRVLDHKLFCYSPMSQRYFLQVLRYSALT